MVSVERVLEYTQLPGESASAGQGQCSPDWPSAGAITATNVSFQYSDASPVILHNLNFAIRGGEKVLQTSTDLLMFLWLKSLS